jgi:hypothetical protein
MDNNKLKELINSDFTPEKVCFWTGAGTSANSPANLPLGDSLTKMAIDFFCLTGTWEGLTQYFEKTKMSDSLGYRKFAPRLEAVLESLIQALGFDILKILDFSYCAKPNSLHNFFAKHLEMDGIHITANFDNCIENAIKNFKINNQIKIIDNLEKSEFSPTTLRRCLIHIHGRYDRNLNNLKRMGVCIRNISSGFSEKLKNLVNYILCQKSYLIFLGYSGRDYFDVNPYFLELKNNKKRFDKLTIVWVKHKEGSNDLIFLDKWQNEQQGKIILDGLNSCSARIFYISIDTNKFLEMLKTRWNFSYKATGLNENEIIKTPSIDENEKVFTTAQLYSSMGIGRNILTLANELRKIAKDIADNHRRFQIFSLLNNGFRDTGLYKHAIKFSRQLPAHTVEDKLFFHYRLADNYWLCGDYIKAACNFRKVILFHGQKINVIRVNEESANDTYHNTLITFLHYFRDIKKLPLIGKFVPLSYGQRVFEKLIKNKEYIKRSPHARAMLVRLHTEIPGLKRKIALPSWLNPPDTEIISYFQETDSILGVVNFSRRRITEDINKQKIPNKNELELLLLQSKIIGDLPGILKSTLLLKNFYGIKDSFVKIALQQIEWLPWLKAAWSLKWCWIDLKRYIKKLKNKIF